MSQLVTDVEPTIPGGLERLWKRQLSNYPGNGARTGFLGLSVVITVVLYFQQYIAGAIGPSIISYFHISFRYYLYVTVLSSAFGAFASLVAGLADRWGRANIVVYGLLAASLITLFGIPHAKSATEYVAFVCMVGIVEGLVLVATPALIRDFSPQLGRGAAMGFWTLGPVLGSLTVSEVSSHTLPHLHAWQDQYMITGSVGLVVFVFALFTLRELSPNLRDQLMVSVRDRKLLEMKVKDIDIGKILEKPWKQMMKLNILVPATSIALFLLIYYAAVGFFVIYFVSVFGFSEAQGNDISNWFWAADAVCVVSVGIISDRFKVRKPFMLIGGIGAIVMTIIFATRATHPSTSYGELVLIAAFLSGFRGVAYSPWMTAFSETIEARNPALVATGLAIWGWILRAVVSISFLILPYVLTSVTPLVTYGPTVKSILALYPAQVATARAIDPATLAALKSNQKDFAAIEKAVKEIAAAQNISSNKALGNLIALRSVPKSDLSYLEAYGVQVETAQKSAPRQWQTWWWVCVAGEVIFVPSIFLLTGRWSPKKARKDAEDHQAKIDAELAKRIWGMQKEEADLALS